MFITVIGFITGVMIGLTGTGGGVLLTPLLMVLTPYPAVTLIGTDIVNGAFTKLLGVFEHRRLGQVRWPLATFLIVGTVPGTIAGMLLLSSLKSRLVGAEVDHLLRLVLGGTLFCVAFLLPLVRLGKAKSLKTWVDAPVRSARLKLIGVGALVGFLVALTSIGCEPCTRAVLPGQHEREGRWWWEDATRKECGLHKVFLESKRAT